MKRSRNDKKHHRKRKKSGRGQGSQPDVPAPIPRKPDAEGIRLNRYIAQAGVCARRKADELIEQGRVKVNGEVVAQHGVRVFPDDEVSVSGRVITPKGLTYILLNKPGDTITTKDDERDRKTVMDLLDVPPAEKGALFPVGRLDRHTVGALLLTNDGELAHRLLHPRYKVKKHYLVQTTRPVTDDELERLVTGITLEDGPARADQAVHAALPNRRVVGILLHEGRNRQIRRMFEALNHEVEALERVRYAGLDTRGLRRGRWRRLEPHEVKRLRSLVKLKA